VAILASDDFNRANANPIGSPWTTAAGVGAMQIVSNAATFATNTDSGCFHSTITWPNDQYSKGKLSVTGTAGGGSGARLLVRHASAADTTYLLAVDHAATNNVVISKVIASVFTNLTGFPVTQAWTDGDTWEIDVVGTTISIYLTPASTGVRAQIGSSVTDSAITSGSPGFGYSSVSTATTIDDWEGGSVGASLAPVGFGGTRRAFGGRGRIRSLNSPSGPFDQRGFLRQRLWDYTLMSAGFTTFTQQLDVTGGAWTANLADQLSFQRSLSVASTFTATLTKALAYARSLPVASTFTAALARVQSYFRTLPVSTAWTSTFSRLALRFKSLSVTGTFTAALAKFNTRQITIAASGTWAAALARARGMLIAVASTFTPSLTKRAFYFKALSVGSSFGAALQRNITKTLAIASTFTVSLVKGRLTLKTLAVTSAMTASIARTFGYLRSLPASSTFVATMTKRLALSQLLAVASPFVPAIAKRLALRIGLSVSSVFSAILTKIKIAFGLETSSLSGNVRNYARLAGSGRSYVRLAGNALTGPRLSGVTRTQARLEGNAKTRPRLEGEVRNYPVAA
jgi:hypothetical protein